MYRKKKKGIIKIYLFWKSGGPPSLEKLCAVDGKLTKLIESK